MNSTRPLCFGSSRHTDSLITHVCQSRQATSKLGDATIGKQLMDGGGFHHTPCCDHGHCPYQTAASGTSRAQDLTLWLAANCLWIEDRRFIDVNKSLSCSLNRHTKPKICNKIYSSSDTKTLMIQNITVARKNMWTNGMQSLITIDKCNYSSAGWKKTMNLGN